MAMWSMVWKPDQFVVEDNGVRQAADYLKKTRTLRALSLVVVQCVAVGAREFAKPERTGALLINAITGDSPHEAWQ